jgi:hypothetical protein
MIHSRMLTKVCASAVVIGGVQLALIVSSPAVRAQTIQPSGIEPLFTIAHISQQTTDTSDGKSSKNVEPTQETPASPWSVYTNLGYTSEYNFRGTNLTPDSDGAIFGTANISFYGFTLGVYGIHQFGTADANSFSIGEGGGGGSAATFLTAAGDNADRITPNNPIGPNLFFSGKLSPVTRQTSFNEVDLYLSYTHELGPLDITVGNIAFLIYRDAETRVTTTGTFTDGTVQPDGTLFDPNGDKHHFTVNGETVAVPTVGNEQFDRLFIAVSAPRLFHSDVFNIVPKVYYYQTVYSDGDDPFGQVPQVIFAHDLAPVVIRFHEQNEHLLFKHGVLERNSSLGGYLEGRVDANFKLGERVTVQPYGLISYSFHDRTEPYGNPQTFRQFVRSRSLVGFNNAQTGVKIPIELWRSHGPSGPGAALDFAPFGAYSYHISDPPAGTNRNELWGGGQVEFTF